MRFANEGLRDAETNRMEVKFFDQNGTCITIVPVIGVSARHSQIHAAIRIATLELDEYSAKRVHAIEVYLVAKQRRNW